MAKKKEQEQKRLSKTALEMLMVKFLTNEEDINKLELENKQYREDIKNQLIESGENKYLLEIDPVDSDYEKRIACSFSIATKAKVSYNVPEVKKILGKNKFNKIVDRKIEVDYEAFVELAKKYEIPQKEAMKCLTIAESINNTKLQSLYDIGEIDLKELKGTFTVDKSLYLTHRRTK